MDNTEQKLWKKCVDFHGHECGGLTIGFKAALYAKRLLDISFSEDEDLVCIAENDACGIDAVQVLLGCTVGKGNLLFHMTGKQAFSFYDRQTGKSVRLLLNKRPEGLTRDKAMDYYQNRDAEDLFTVMETRIPLPDPAKIFISYDCEGCGESTGENWIRLREGKKLCPDCFQSYNRFRV